MIVVFEKTHCRFLSQYFLLIVMGIFYIRYVCNERDGYGYNEDFYEKDLCTYNE